jgi:hypothetical protein
VDYLTFIDMESLKYMCETMDIQWSDKGMLILCNDNSSIGKNDSLTMPIQYSSTRHPKKMLKVKQYLGYHNWFDMSFLCHNALRFMCLLIELYGYKV